jgi:2-oxo-3-hexenedioate decarboxylase
MTAAPVSPHDLDLRLVEVVFEHNGQVMETAVGAAAFGHPAAAVAWLVRALASQGDGLRSGQIVLSGGLSAAEQVPAGDSVIASISRPGSIRLACA